MSVRIFKIVDGSELIGRVKNFNNSSEIFKLEDPLEIKYRMSMHTGLPIAVMVKYNFFGDEVTINLNASAVIASYEVSDKYVKIYEKSLDTVRNGTVEVDNPESNTAAATPPQIHKSDTVH